VKNNTTILGYDSMSDFLHTNLGFASMKWNTIGAALMVLTSFISGYIYNDAQAVYFLLFALSVDGITGTWVAIKQNRFSSARLPRVLLTMVFYCLLLSLSWNAAKFNAIFYFLPGIIYGGLMTTILVSVFENVYWLGYLPKSIFVVLKQRLRINKILESEINPESKQEEEKKD